MEQCASQHAACVIGPRSSTWILWAQLVVEDAVYVAASRHVSISTRHPVLLKALWNAQGMERQILGFTQRRLADALHLEELGVEKTSLLSGIKLIIMELAKVFSVAV
jgi:hypothetical protein